MQTYIHTYIHTYIKSNTYISKWAQRCSLIIQKRNKFRLFSSHARTKIKAFRNSKLHAPLSHTKHRIPHLSQYLSYDLTVFTCFRIYFVPIKRNYDSNKLSTQQNSLAHSVAGRWFVLPVYSRTWCSLAH